MENDPKDQLSEDILPRVREIFRAMDRAYGAAAEAAGFHCAGCEETCCKTLFHHHTLAEWLLLGEAVEALPRDVREEVLARAREVAAAEEAFKPENGRWSTLCPANRDGLCLVYESRPMVCRLHGVAWRFFLPDGRERTGTGCALYEEAAGEMAEPPAILDRTPFYRELSSVEKELRGLLGFGVRVRMSVARMMVDDFSQALSGLYQGGGGRAAH